MNTPNLDRLGQALLEEAKDIRVNLGIVLRSEALTVSQRWGTALASAYATREPLLIDSLSRDAAEALATMELDQAVVSDARAAAVLMGMNNIYYRFTHHAADPAYAALPARLRMTRLAKAAGIKIDFELFCLAVSAIHGCSACVAAHERVVREAGLPTLAIQDAIRIASTVHAAALALAIGADVVFVPHAGPPGVASA